jgi:hypothetical protein
MWVSETPKRPYDLLKLKYVPSPYEEWSTLSTSNCTASSVVVDVVDLLVVVVRLVVAVVARAVVVLLAVVSVVVVA